MIGKWFAWNPAPEPEQEPEPEQPRIPAPTDPVRLGGEASRLLNDPVMQLAFDHVADELTAMWKRSMAGQHEQREEAYRLLWALEGVRTRLKSFTANAKLVAAELERKRAEQERRPARTE